MKTVRLQMIIGYDGRPFSGWQSQADRNAVQDHLETALANICGHRVTVHGSGRTDAGVHAIGQSAHVEVPWVERSPDTWCNALNFHLPPAIRIKRIRPVPKTFHARFSACGKTYRYRIFHENWLDPLEEGRAWHVPGHLDFAAMQSAARLLTGKHDFRAFAANRGRVERSTVRHVWRIGWQRSGPCITLTMEGEGFLYKMVRMLSAVIVRVGQGKVTLAGLERMITDPQAPKSTFVAPAHGLYLVRVAYQRRSSLSLIE